MDFHYFHLARSQERMTMLVVSFRIVNLRIVSHIGYSDRVRIWVFFNPYRFRSELNVKKYICITIKIHSPAVLKVALKFNILTAIRVNSVYRKKEQIPIFGYFRVFKKYPPKSQIWKSEISPNQGIWLGIS